MASTWFKTITTTKKLYTHGPGNDGFHLQPKNVTGTCCFSSHQRLCVPKWRKEQEFPCFWLGLELILLLRNFIGKLEREIKYHSHGSDKPQYCSPQNTSEILLKKVSRCVFQSAAHSQMDITKSIPVFTVFRKATPSFCIVPVAVFIS